MLERHFGQVGSYNHSGYLCSEGQNEIFYKYKTKKCFCSKVLKIYSEIYCDWHLRIIKVLSFLQTFWYMLTTIVSIYLYFCKYSCIHSYALMIKRDFDLNLWGKGYLQLLCKRWTIPYSLHIGVSMFSDFIDWSFG